MDSPFFTDRITLRSGALEAEISPFGAELCSLRRNDREWLWQGDETSWPRRAPVLFPHCGRNNNSAISVDGRSWPNQPIHGFAPTSHFAITRHTPTSLTLSLHDTIETRRLYPFAFALEVRFQIEGDELVQEIHCTNRNEKIMPVAAGFHPGFQWPLPSGGAKGEHILRFAEEETDPIALPDENGLMGTKTMPSPVKNSVLPLNDDLFSAGSTLFTRLRSRALWFGIPGQPGLAMRFTTPFLVLWRWPGTNRADYICIEPWAGLPDPVGFADDLRTKPGITNLAPGETQFWLMALCPEA